MNSKNNRPDHVAWVQPKSDSDPGRDNLEERSPIIPISPTPILSQMSEDRLSWIDGMKLDETPISHTSQSHPPPEHKTPSSVHSTRNTYVAPDPIEPKSEMDRIISPSPLSRKKSVWDEPVPLFVSELPKPTNVSLLSPESIIVSTAPPSPPKNVLNLPSEMEWLVEYAATRNAIKLDRDTDKR